MINKINIILVLIILFIGFSELRSQILNIKISVSVNKKTYFECEPIFIYIAFRNSGIAKDSIRKSVIHDIENHLWAENESGKIVNPISIPDEYFPDDYDILNPGESTIHKYQLDYELGFVDFGNHYIGNRYFFPEGKYWAGYYKKWTYFEVVHPDRINEEALAGMIKAFSISIKNNVADSLSLKASIFYDIYKNYPGSIYEQDAFTEYSKYYVTYHEIDSSVFPVFNDFVNRFPDNEKIDLILLYISKSIYKRNDSNAVNDYLNKLVERYSGQKAGIYAKELLNSENYKN